MLILYVPCGSEKEARDIGKILVEERLVACVNIVKSESVYMWEDVLKEEPEWIILAKTLEEKADDAENRVRELHSYDLPCIIRLNAEANGDYLDWVKESIA
jgi:periplasmic divalent cation tolerance protein